MARPRDARQPVRISSGYATLHQPVAVGGQQQRGQQDGQLSLRRQEHVRTPFVPLGLSRVPSPAAPTRIGRSDQR